MLIGKRVYLRALEPERDLEKCFYWINDREVTRNLLFYPPVSREAEMEWLSKMSRHGVDGTYSFGIVVKENDVYIGNCGLHSINELSRHAELGIMIGDRSYWDRGFGSDAVRILCSFAFRDLNLNRVYLNVYSNNPRAIKSYEKVGFRQEGLMRQHRFLEGVYVDQVVMGLLRDEFQE
ncbi:MAG: GNAT family protein [Candidatus Wallbacteria bacterium]|nr:GNAT family protein [Candidatus Wallbacteria bacterium]